MVLSYATYCLNLRKYGGIETRGQRLGNFEHPMTKGDGIGGL